jgi:hypothetical protein
MGDRTVTSSVSPDGLALHVTADSDNGRILDATIRWRDRTTAEAHRATVMRLFTDRANWIDAAIDSGVHDDPWDNRWVHDMGVAELSINERAVVVPSRSGRALSLVGEFIASLAVGVATWAAWLGWDNTYYYDATVGALQGPYRPSQVIGCAVTVALLTGLLALRWHPAAVAAGMTVGFWAAWTLQAGSEDQSGLYMIGSIMLLAGLLFATAVASAIGNTARGLWPRRNK